MTEILRADNHLGTYGSFFLSMFLSFLFVGSLYVWKQDFPRNHPVTVKRRFISAGTVSVLSILITYSMYQPPLGSSLSFLEMMGIRLSGLFTATVLPLLLTSVLFLGPLGLLYYDPNLRDDVFDFQDLLWWRNFIVGPLCEEICFRCCLFALLLQGGWGYTHTVLCSCILFGLAHAHHLYTHGNIFSMCFQLFYTTIFGIYAGFLFVRTGNLIAPFLSHWFCNYMGFPRLDLVFELKLKDAMIVSTLFVLGVCFFGIGLFPLTDPSLYSNPFYELFP